MLFSFNSNHSKTRKRDLVAKRGDNDRLLGRWAFFYAFEEGQYISTNGCGPLRIFDSYQEMLEKDAFPHGYVTEDYCSTKDFHQASSVNQLLAPYRNKPI